MLSKKQIRMLEILNKQVSTCRRCDLWKNGVAIPRWSKKSRYAIIGEAPGYNEVRLQTPFVGAAGKILTTELYNFKFKSDDFLIINTCQCRPVEGRINSKPTEKQIRACQCWLRKYLKVLDPEKILCLGNYAKYLFTGDVTGILSVRGQFRHLAIDQTTREYPVLYTIHPAYCIYNNEEGIPMLREDISLFKKKKFDKKGEGWLFSEDDFRV